LAESGLNTPFIALCPFTTRPQKHWINAHWQTLIDDLLALGGYPLAILGGPDDSTAAATLIGDRPVVNLAGKTNLQQAGVVIKHAACVVGVDTGLTHMGHAAETPTIAIFGSTRPYLDAQKPASVIIYQDRHCSPCKRRPTCDGRFDCMHEITPAQVLTQVQYALTSNAVAK